MSSEGEEWLRVRLDADTTAFLLARFTTPDEDGSGGGLAEGDDAPGLKAIATRVATVLATPLDDGRVIRALSPGESARALGLTQSAGRTWYLLRLSDGAQGFAPRDAFRVDPGPRRWIYPDGTEAPGPNIPQGMTEPVDLNALPSAEAVPADAGSDPGGAAPPPSPAGPASGPKDQQ